MVTAIINDVTYIVLGLAGFKSGEEDGAEAEQGSLDQESEA